MDTFSEFAFAGVDWLANRAGAVLILAAGLPSVFLLKNSRFLGYGALAVLVGAVALILLGSEGVAAAILVTALNILLVSVASFSTRKRLTQAEERLDAVTSAIRDLEVSEERRQVFSAKQPRATRLR